MIHHDAKFFEKKENVKNAPSKKNISQTKKNIRILPKDDI